MRINHLLGGVCNKTRPTNSMYVEREREVLQRTHKMFWSLALVMCTLVHFEANAQQNNTTCDVDTEQPAVTILNPPSGTTGSSGGERGLSSTYSLQGERFDSISRIEIQFPPPQNNAPLTAEILQRNSTAISFEIPQTSFQRMPGGTPAILAIYPANTACQNISLSMTLHETVVFISLVSLRASPGTTISTDRGTCVPNICGDNSTTFTFEVGGIILERLNSTRSANDFVIARFPNFDGAVTGASFVLVTQYQQFALQRSLTFELERPGTIASITPSGGQRGTRVTIRGQRLLGSGDFISLSRVMLGQIEAEITGDLQNNEIIEIRAGRGGVSGNVSITINTTHEFPRETVLFPGPYTYLENAWVQLEDGLVRDIIPPAAQPGRTVLLCGDRLLGGGSIISTLLLAGQTLSMFNSTPSTLQLISLQLTSTSQECITAVVPTPSAAGVTGRVTLEADTGALVESSDNFTFADIATVVPQSGQPGTTVTISGVALLSGYNTAMPTVYLSGVQAMLLSYSSTRVVVRAASPPPPVGSGMMSILDDIFGAPGDISIVVAPNVTNLTTFSVSMESSWTYLAPGEITNISPNFGQVGTQAVINGTNLLGYGSSLLNATVGGVNAIIVSNTTSQVVLLIPDLGPNGQNATIALFSDSGAVIIGENLFEYRERGVVLSTAPSQGQNGTYVTITGTNLFGYGSNITAVMLGSIQATIDYNQANNTSITVRASANNNVASTNVSVTIVANTNAMVISAGDIWTYLIQGSVETVSPSEGQVGTRIEINGTSLLGGGASVDSIFLDGVMGNVVSATTTRIVVTMSDISTRDETFFPGQVYIRANTGAVVFGGAYTHRASGQITAFSPQSGRRGTRIVLSGINLLGFGTNVDSVLVGGMPGTLESFDNTSATIRAGSSSAGTVGPIQLIINTGAIISSTTNFTYESSGMISEVVPRMGAEGSGLLIRGMALTPSTSQVVNVTIGGNPVSRIVTAADSEISVIVGPAPAMNPNSAVIVITAADGSIVDGETFSFINLAISLPGRNSGQEGTLIDIQLPNAPNFEPSLSMRATVDDQEAQVVSMNATLQQITVQVPRARRQGMFTADVAVESLDRLVARLRNGFTYLPEGNVFSIEPNFGQLGTRVVIRGANLLGGGTSIDTVSLAGAQANVRSGNNERIEVDIMENLPSASYPLLGDVILTANTGAVTRRLDGFTLVQPGEITSVSPITGQFGTRVTINGSNLLQGTTSNNVSAVALAGVPVNNILLASQTQIIVEAASAASAGTPGQVVVTLTSGARVESPLGITFRYLQPGRISTVTPNSGPVGTNILISGTNLLGGGSSISLVSLGGVQANIIRFSDTQIDVTAMEGAPGMGDVIITSNTGTIINGSSMWTYEELGVITQVSPTIGQQGVQVNITGQRLLSSSSMRLDECRITGVVAEVSSFTDSRVICRAGPNPNPTQFLTGPVSLTSNTGVTVVSMANNTNFTYYPASITQIEPQMGNNGTIVTITGTNLYGYSGSSFDLQQVLFGSIEATIISRSLSTIQVRAGAFDGQTVGDTVRVESTSGAFLELPNIWNFTQPRTISDISPSIGRPGDITYLFGQSLTLASASSVQVTVGGVLADRAQVINDTTIQLTLGIYQGVANPGVSLPVQVTYSTGETIYNGSVTFIYNSTEGAVSSISPQAGNGQVMVIINGTNLLNNQSLVRVSLAGITANIVNSTEGRIIVEAGTLPNGGASGPVVIERDDGSIIGLGGNAWTYYPSLMPGNVSPNTGQNGTVVTIDLSQLTGVPAIERVTLASVPATDISLDATSNMLTVRAGPSDATANGEIAVQFSDNSVLRIPGSWRYQTPVAINNITPPGMQGYFNTSLTLNGANFQAGAVTVDSITLAGVEASIESQNNTQIRVRITRQLNTTESPIVGPIVIVSSQGATFVSSNNFTYVQVRVNNVSPQMGQRGTRVTVSGVGLLLGGTAVSTFWLGNIPADVRSINDTSITVAAGDFPMQTNLSDIRYIMNTGAVITVENSWRYIVPGEIQTVTPTNGSLGTLVTITGTNLFGGGSSAEMVILNNVPAVEIVVNFESLIQVLAGPSSTALNPGNVQVISDTGAVTESASSVEFAYLEPGRIASVTPSEGQNGTRVRVMGSYLHNGERIRRVFLAGVEAEIVTINENDLVAGIPATIDVIAGRPSMLGSFSGPVVIESNFNTTTVSTISFTYRPEGFILTVSPTVGQNSTVVTITGQDLFGGGASVQQVYLAGIEADILSQNNTEVTVSAGENAFGRTGDIVLISNTNAYVRRIDGWTYLARAVINTISPSMGQFGTRVTVRGERLLLGASSIQSVFFNNISAFSVESSTDASLTIRAGQPTSNIGFLTNTITIVSSLEGVFYQPFTWNYTDASQIMTVDPPNGTSLTLVTVTGTNLYGGGTRIASVTVAGIPADMIVSPNSTVVTFRTGLNMLGSMLAGGVIVLESDTGARTESPSAWEYEDDCPPGTFGTVEMCRDCDLECELCFGPTDFDCYTCANFSLIHPDSRMQCVPECANVSTLDRECRDACELNQYVRVNSTDMELFCYNCSELCDPNRMCSGPEPTQCGACRSVYNTLNGSCVEQCPVGTYSNESNDCLPCDSQCTPEGGCFGPSAAECFSCSNVSVSASLLGGFDSESSDVCLERCPSEFYLDSATSTCRPCSPACVGCTGPTPYDCIACLNSSFVENVRARCVLSCNQNSSKLYYDDPNGLCQRCDSRCSITEGCFGPTARECNSCETPMVEISNDVRECVISCNNTHFHNIMNNLCVRCDPSCTNGCTGPTAQDCIQSSAFNAGPGTIAIVIIIIIALVIIVVLLSVFLFWTFKKQGKYKVEERPQASNNNIELGERYTPAHASFSETTLTKKGKENGQRKESVVKVNPVFNEDDTPTAFYTERGPEEGDSHADTAKTQDQGPELYTDMSAGEINKSGAETGSQDFYTDMSPGPLEQETVAPERPPKPGDKPKPPKPEPYKIPVKKEEESKPAAKPPLQCPPSPEMYIDMGGTTQEIRLNQGTGLSQDLYDDVQTSQPEKQGDQAPLLTPAADDLYEDTDTAVTSAQRYIRTSGIDLPTVPPRQPEPLPRAPKGSTPLPPLPPAGQGPATEQPPALPQRPPPKKRSAQPLPETPLEKSLSGSSISSQPTSPVSPVNVSVPDAIYEDTILPQEESLYEPIPTREGNQQLIQQLEPQPAPKPGKGNKLKGRKK